MEQNIPVGCRLVTVPLSALHISPHNARPNDKSDVRELADLIDSQGLLQNLIIIEEQPGWGVVGGGRRTRAMNLLVERKKLDADQPVVCLLTDDHEQALSLSVAENSGREDMTPAQEFRAFRGLHQQGIPVENIAARFGVTPMVVRRRLALADIHPSLVAAYEDGEMQLDALQAFTMASSHKQQLDVWKSLGQHMRHAHYIKQALMNGKTNVNHDRLSRFVGLDAYEAAGGSSVRDLFGGPTSGYITDVALMHTLAAAKLDAAADSVRAEGWAFVDVHPDLTWKHTERFSRSKPATRELTADEKTEISELEAAIAELNEKIDEERENAAELTDGDVEAIEAEISAKQARIREIRDATSTFSDRQRKKSGVVMGISQSGELQVNRGMIRPVDPKVAKQKELEKRKEAAAADGEPEPIGLSDALMRKLTANRTAALAAHLLECPRVALDLLCARLLTDVLYDSTFYGLGEVHVAAQDQGCGLLSAANDLDGSKAHAAIEERRAELRTRLPEDPALVFAWLGEQTVVDVVEIMSFCTAATLNAITGDPKHRPLAQLQETIGLNVADWWEPTRKSFLDQVSKPVIIGALKEVGFGEDALTAAAKLKKGDLAAYAEEALANSGWLPPPLRAKNQTAPSLVGSKQTAAQEPAQAEKALVNDEPKQEAQKQRRRVKKTAAPVDEQNDQPSVAKDGVPSRAGGSERIPLHPAAAWPFPTGRN